jgi:formylglycine-generating enzyme required for sulfatase activity
MKIDALPNRAARASRTPRDAAELITAIIAVRRTRVPQKPPMLHVPWGWIGATAASVLAIGWVGAHQLGVPVWWPGDARPILEPSKDDLAAAAKTAVLKKQATAAEQRRREETEAKTKSKAEAERQRFAALQAELERQRREEEARKRDPISALAPGSGNSARAQLTDGSPCPFCPEMVVVPGGEFRMGSDEYSEEKPLHKVTIAKPFAVGRFEVTFAEWDACVSGGGCKHQPDDVMRVSWDDITEDYLPWLSRKAGKSYRLLTEAEWEYAARSGSRSEYSWGDEIGKNRANCDGCGSQWDNKQTAPVGSFQANAFGLHDMHGNVSEWIADCYKDSYSNAPSDGKAVADGAGCLRVIRGGSWWDHPQLLRTTHRIGGHSDYRLHALGFRVARTLNP